MSEPYFDFEPSQNYDKLKAECLKSKKLFEDNLFPASDASLYRFNKTPSSKVFWKRPYEFLPKQNPEFIVDSIVPEDIDQGYLGDCWFISSMSAVATDPSCINKVVLNDQSFKKEEYCGLFRFRFYLTREGKHDQFSEWTEIVVDDRLPVDENNELIFCHNNKDKNEMFGPLLEKAYAKFKICYEFLSGGYLTDGVEDLTSGLHQILRANFTEDLPDNLLWEIIFKARSLSSLGGASIRPTDKLEEVMRNGLVRGHAYSILETYELTMSENGMYEHFREWKDRPIPNSLKLIKLRNPWGQSDSYNGSWGRKSQEWQVVHPKIAQEIGGNKQDDGNFFMEFKDFSSTFERIDFVHNDLNAFHYNGKEYNKTLKWSRSSFDGSWIKGKTNGAQGDMATFFKNPQFQIHLDGSAVLYLNQTSCSKRRLEKMNPCVAVNMHVFKVKEGHYGEEKKYDLDDLIYVYSLPSYMPYRSITSRIDVEPGSYVVVPSAFYKEDESNFHIDIWYEDKNATANDSPKNQNHSADNNNISNNHDQPLKDFAHQVVSKACLIM